MQQDWAHHQLVGAVPGNTLVKVPQPPFAVAIESLRAGMAVATTKGRSLVQIVVVCDTGGGAHLCRAGRDLWVASRQPMARVTRRGELQWTCAASRGLRVEQHACAALYTLVLVGEAHHFLSPEGIALASLGGGLPGYWGSAAAREKVRLYQMVPDPVLDSYTSRGLAHFRRVRVARNAAGETTDFDAVVVGHDPHPSLAPTVPFDLAPATVVVPPPTLLLPPSSVTREQSRAFWAARASNK